MQEFEMDGTSTAAAYILDLLSERKMNQVSVQYVMTQTSNLVNKVMEVQLSKIKRDLQLQGVDISVLNSLSFDSKINLFSNLKTQYSQNAYFAREFGMIVPTKIFLQPTSIDIGRHKTGKDQCLKKPSYVYVSLLKTIERLLNFTDVDKVINDIKLDDREQIWTKYQHGSNFKNSIFFQKHLNAIQVHLYLDEVQVCNEFASHTKNNKLVFVYFSIGNLNQKLRSSLASIYLLSIFTNNQMVRFGLNTLLRPIVEDLKKIENGIEMTVNGQP